MAKVCGRSMGDLLASDPEVVHWRKPAPAAKAVPTCALGSVTRPENPLTDRVALSHQSSKGCRCLVGQRFTGDKPE